MSENANAISDSIDGPFQEILERVQRHRAETNARCDHAIAALNEAFANANALVADLVGSSSASAVGAARTATSGVGKKRRKSGKRARARSYARARSSAKVVKSALPLKGHGLTVFRAIPAGGRARLMTLAKAVGLSIEHTGGCLTSLIRHGHVKRVGRGVYARA